jgi:hypothetical protein
MNDKAVVGEKKRRNLITLLMKVAVDFPGRMVGMDAP